MSFRNFTLEFLHKNGTKKKKKKSSTFCNKFYFFCLPRRQFLYEVLKLAITEFLFNPKINWFNIYNLK